MTSDKEMFEKCVAQLIVQGMQFGHPPNRRAARIRARIHAYKDAVLSAERAGCGYDETEEIEREARRELLRECGVEVDW